MNSRLKSKALWITTGDAKSPSLPKKSGQWIELETANTIMEEEMIEFAEWIGDHGWTYNLKTGKYFRYNDTPEFEERTPKELLTLYNDQK